MKRPPEIEKITNRLRTSKINYVLGIEFYISQSEFLHDYKEILAEFIIRLNKLIKSFEDNSDLKEVGKYHHYMWTVHFAHPFYRRRPAAYLISNAPALAYDSVIRRLEVLWMEMLHGQEWSDSETRNAIVGKYVCRNAIIFRRLATLKAQDTKLFHYKNIVEGILRLGQSRPHPITFEATVGSSYFEIKEEVKNLQKKELELVVKYKPLFDQLYEIHKLLYYFNVNILLTPIIPSAMFKGVPYSIQFEVIKKCLNKFMDEMELKHTPGYLCLIENLEDDNEIGLYLFVTTGVADTKPKRKKIRRIWRRVLDNDKYEPVVETFDLRTNRIKHRETIERVLKCLQYAPKDANLKEMVYAAPSRVAKLVDNLTDYIATNQ